MAETVGEIDILGVDPDDHCAMARALQAAKVRLACGLIETMVRYRDGDSEEQLQNAPPNAAQIDKLYAYHMARCLALSGRSARRCIIAG